MTESIVVQLVKAQADLDACRALLADAWVKVPMRWSKIAAGALIADDRARLWIVTEREQLVDAGDVEVTITRPGSTKLFMRTVHPDDQVNVLMPVGERDALQLVRGELGAEIIPVVERER